MKQTPAVDIKLRPGTMDADITEEMCRDPYLSLPLVKPGDFVVDCGANIGAFSCFLLQHQPDVRITCIEPVPSNAACLRANVGHYKQCSVVEAALMGQSGTVKMYDFGMEASGCHSTVPMDITGRTTVEVVALTLEDIMKTEGRTRIDFLKLDTQGAEYDIVATLSTETLRKVNYLALEMHDAVAKPGQVLGLIPGAVGKMERLVRKLAGTHLVIHGVPGKTSILVWKNRDGASFQEQARHARVMQQWPVWLLYRWLKMCKWRLRLRG